jgi:hypothetical protein
MDTSSNRTFDRVGAAAGFVSVALLLALFNVFPSIPAPSKGIDAIAGSAATDRGAHLLAAYVGTLLSGALVVFGAAVVTALRRSDVRGDGWWIVALAGITIVSAIGIVADALVIVLVRAVGHGLGGDSLWLAYGGDHWLGTLMGVPFGVFLLGAGMGSRATRVLPRWLSWSAIALAAALGAGAGSVTGDEVDGGPLGVVLLLGYVGVIVWMIGVSVVLWRRPALERVEVVPSPA